MVMIIRCDRCDNDFRKSDNGGDSDAGFDVVNENDDVS